MNMHSTKKTRPVFSRQQLGLSAIFNIFAAVLSVGFLNSMPEGFILSEEVTKRTIGLLYVSASVVLFLLLCVGIFWLGSMALDSGSLLAYVVALVMVFAAVRCIIALVKTWRKLN